MKAWWVFIVFCFCLSFGAGKVFSEQEKTLEPILVIESPIISENVTDRYAAQKTMVTEHQIEDLNAQDIANALRMTPGINISRYNMVGSFGGAQGGAVFIRGMGSSRPGAEIKTHVDGIPMFMSVWNHPLLDLMSIDAGQAIEIHKSPQPHIYGNAFGIVNIVPKRATKEGFITKADFQGGSHSTFVTKLEHGGLFGKTDYYLGASYKTSEGHREKAEGELKDFYGRLGHKLSDKFGFYLFTLANSNYAEDPGPVSNPGDRRGRYETKAWLREFTLENNFGNVNGSLKIYQNTGEGNWLGNLTNKKGVLEYLYNEFDYYGLKLKEGLNLWPQGEIILGYDWDVTKGSYYKELTDGTKDRWEPHQFTISSPYLAISHMFGSREGFYLIPSGGIRYYHHSYFDSEWAPQAGFVLGYQGLEFHGAYTKGLLFPGLDVVVMSEKNITQLGNSWMALNPERLNHYEAGLGYTFKDLFSSDLTFFYEDGKDRYVVVPAPPIPPRYANIEEYTIKGVEFSLSIFPQKDLSLFLGAAYLKTDPSDLPYAPKWTFSGGLNYRFMEDYKIALDCQYVDRVYTDSQARRLNAVNTTKVDSYFLVNGKVSKAFRISKVKGQIYLAGENLTDEDYEYYPGYPMPGITGYVGIKLEF